MTICRSPSASPTMTSIGDAVKVTVIATGFRVETPLLDAVRDSKPFMDQIPSGSR